MKRRAAVLWSALCLALCASNAPARLQGESFQIRADQVEGEWRCSIYAARAPLGDLLASLARQCGATVAGFEHVPSSALVDVDLRDRPVHQALDYVLGSAGLAVEHRAGTWRVSASTGAALTADALREEALGALRAALVDFPEHQGAAVALMGRGRIELERGHPSVAAADFDELVARFPDSPLVPEALLRAGHAQGLDLRWEDAAQRYAELLRLESAHPFESEARLELARCAAWMGDSSRALILLDGLDDLDPNPDKNSLRARQLVRVRALIEDARCEESLKLLDVVESARLVGAQKLEAFELRARAFEELERPGDAARAWLAFAQACDGNDRTRGLRHAARLALEAGEELSVLFISQMAQGSPAQSEFDALAEQARERLELFASSPRDASPAERLGRGEELVLAGNFVEARDALAVLGLSRARLSQDELLRFALAYGRALYRTDGCDEAMNVLRDLLPSIADSAARRAIYLLAGELLEDSGRIDEAIEAYQGKL
jgi:tetratricopeptide (TPR) repeat protein